VSSNRGGRKQSRCGIWMVRAETACDRAEGHAGAHMTAVAVRKMYARSVAYHREQITARYKKINEYKLSKGCTDCGYDDNAVALDFDHRNPSLKIKSISSMLMFSWRKIITELDKCDIRCANCHRVKTHRLGQERRRPASTEADGPLA
jgi:hypothetical protein